jgi:hypothetical protein
MIRSMTAARGSGMTESIVAGTPATSRTLGSFSTPS